jgi:hypothetical protein
MSDLQDDLGLGFRHPRIAVSDQRTGAIIDLPEPVAVALLESEPRVRLAYERYWRMAGQWMAPPERRGRLIVFDHELLQRVLGELPAEVLSELRAEFPDEEEEREAEGLLDDLPPHKQLPLDRHLRELTGGQRDLDNPTFISPLRRGASSPRRHAPRGL